MGTPVNISELSGEGWGGGCPGGLVTRAGSAIRLLAAQHEVTLRLLDAIHRDHQRLVCVRASS